MSKVLEDDIRVIFQDMPPSIKAVTSESGDSFFTIIINSRCAYQAQREAYAHELSHINAGDFDRVCEEASEIELCRHKK